MKKRKIAANSSKRIPFSPNSDRLRRHLLPDGDYTTYGHENSTADRGLRAAEKSNSCTHLCSKSLLDKIRTNITGNHTDSDEIHVLKYLNVCNNTPFCNALALSIRPVRLVHRTLPLIGGIEIFGGRNYFISKL